MTDKATPSPASVDSVMALHEHAVDQAISKHEQMDGNRCEAAESAYHAAIIASLCGDVEPSLYRGTKLLPYEVRYFGTPGMAERLGYTDDRKDYFDASTVAALKARVAELEKDAARYRWLRQEHERFDPICHLTWKAGGNRNSSEWVNTAVLDSSIDAALTKGQQ